MSARGKGRRAAGRIGRSSAAAVAALVAVLVGGTRATQDAIANGDTRTIEIQHEHTKESAAVTFKRNGTYDPEALKQLNWLLRDWRLDEPTRMDPKLFDILWQVYREVGATEPIRVVSAYRAPQTNAMLRRRSRAVSEHSQHMRGKAMDFYLPGVSMARVREVGMRLQEGGVGFYPNAFNPFVHLDSGSVRSWPRMSGGELARLFPDGRTVHLPRDGKPLPGYDEARATILARGGSVAGYAAYAEAEEPGPRKSLWATLFGGGSDDEDSEFYRSASARQKVAARPLPSGVTAYAGPVGDDGGARAFLASSSAPAGDAGPRRAVRAEPASRARTQPVPAEPASLPAEGAGEDAGAGVLAGRATLPPGTRIADPDGPKILAAIPVPPRRPADMAVLMAAAPLGPSQMPPLRPAPVAGTAAVLPSEFRGEAAARTAARNSSAPAGPADDRAALKALFEAAAITTAAPSRRAEVPTTRTRTAPIALGAILSEPGTRVRTVFASGSPEAPDTAGFTGPAVAPLTILR